MSNRQIARAGPDSHSDDYARSERSAIPNNRPYERVTSSVISHSNPESLARCLNALEVAQRSCSFSAGVTVIDNASRDGSAEMVRELYPHARVIDQHVRRGFAANHNSVIKATMSDYVLILNDDTEVAPDALALLVKFLDVRPEVGVVGPRILDGAGVSMDSALALPSITRSAKLAISLGLWDYVQSRGTDRRPVGFVHGCALLMRRSALDAVGPFDESFFMYREDVDLCKRMHDGGYEVWFLPEAAVKHIGRASTARYPRARVTEMWRSNALYCQKHFGPIAAWAEPRLRGCVYVVRWAVLRALVFLLRGRVTLGQMTVDELACNARATWLGPRGPGLREMADEWNAACRADGPPPKH